MVCDSVFSSLLRVLLPCRNGRFCMVLAVGMPGSVTGPVYWPEHSVLTWCYEYHCSHPEAVCLQRADAAVKASLPRCDVHYLGLVNFELRLETLSPKSLGDHRAGNLDWWPMSLGWLG